MKTMEQIKEQLKHMIAVLWAGMAVQALNIGLAIYNGVNGHYSAMVADIGIVVLLGYSQVYLFKSHQALKRSAERQAGSFCPWNLVETLHICDHEPCRQECPLNNKICYRWDICLPAKELGGADNVG